ACSLEKTYRDVIGRAAVRRGLYRAHTPAVRKLGGKMTRFVASAFALVVVTFGVASTHTRADERTLPMRFELRQQSGACSENCRTWISASGSITADTPKDFQAFAQGRDLHGMLMALDSDGGSVLGAMSLGRAIRKLDIVTTVGRAVAARDGGIALS